MSDIKKRLAEAEAERDRLAEEYRIAKAAMDAVFEKLSDAGRRVYDLRVEADAALPRVTMRRSYDYKEVEFVVSRRTSSSIYLREPGGTTERRFSNSRRRPDYWKEARASVYRLSFYEKDIRQPDAK